MLKPETLASYNIDSKAILFWMNEETWITPALFTKSNPDWLLYLLF